MYTDRKKKRWPALCIAAAVILLVVVLPAVLLLRSSKDDVRADSIDAIEQAIQRTAQQCYAVEGIYPPSLDYLCENYGLQLNTEDFYIIYEAYASNQPPEIRVAVKNG